MHRVLHYLYVKSTICLVLYKTTKSKLKGQYEDQI